MSRPVLPARRPRARCDHTLALGAYGGCFGRCEHTERLRLREVVLVLPTPTAVRVDDHVQRVIRRLQTIVGFEEGRWGGILRLQRWIVKGAPGVTARKTRPNLGKGSSGLKRLGRGLGAPFVAIAHTLVPCSRPIDPSLEPVKG
jgi:hypothetical protein